MSQIRKLGSVKRIALVAHDHKKKDLVDWAKANREFLAPHELVATGTTGKMLEENLNLSIKKLYSGPLGGDQQIGALIAEGNLDMIVFFWDPMEAQPHDSDVKALLRLAVAWNILMACNWTTADFLLSALLMKEDYTIRIPDYSDYLKRKV